MYNNRIYIYYIKASHFIVKSYVLSIYIITPIQIADFFFKFEKLQNIF